MNIRGLIGATIGAGICLTQAAGVASAFSVSTVPLTDTEFNAFLLSDEFTELFVAESRGGDNNGTAGDREIGINQPLIPNGQGGLTGGLPFPGAQQQRTWVSGQAVAFSLSFDAINDVVTYTVGNDTLTATTDSFDPNGIFLRTMALGQNSSSGAKITLHNLMLDDGNGFQALPDLISATSDNTRDTNYMQISGLNASFTLTGEEILEWTGSFPRGSRLATQVKLGAGPLTASFDDTPDVVPEPVTVLGSLAALGLGVAMKKKLGAAA